MKTIYKYQLSFDTENVLQIPRASEILSVGNQQGYLYMWAKVDTDIENESRIFHIYGTGEEFPELNEGVRHKSFRGRIFIGTVQMDVFVWHVFEIVQM